MKKKNQTKFGYLIVRKPKGPTSHDVVDKLRSVTGVRRIGHAGILDSLASGVLLIGINRLATRNLGKFVGLDKHYIAILRLGYTSNTYDAKGKILKVSSQKLTVDLVFFKKVLKSFIGVQKQVPPIYSAKKTNGKKAYQLARAGKKVKLKPQQIEIYDINLINSKLESDQTITIKVHCSSGTYIRSLANDIGQKIGCGAYLKDLKRTAIGNFNLSEAVALASLNKSNWTKFLINFKTVMATGTFEILHQGHKFYLREAKKLGQKLVVIVARQSRAEKLRHRKLCFNQKKRLAEISNLKFVDQVLLGDKKDQYQSIKKIKPDIIALGYDQKETVMNLGKKIKELGLKTRIARIRAYRPEEFKSSLLIKQ